MCEPTRPPLAEIDRLRHERQGLLDELEMVYQQLSRTLETSAAEQRITYAELDRRNAQLENRLHQVEELNARLQESQRLLRQSERLSMVGQLAAMIVHEIRGPLTGISAQAEMLLMREVTDAQRRGLDLILKAAWRLNELTDRVLRFSRAHDEEAEVVSLGEVVTRVHELLAPLATAGVSLEKQVDPDVLLVRGGASSLDQVLTNLILNGLDAVAPTGGRLVATMGVARIDADDLQEDGGWTTTHALPVEELLADGPFAYVEIADNGTGIDPQLLPRLFEPLFTTKPVGKGTGLGLAICRNIVRGLGGNMRIVTRSGQGTRVRVYVPLMEAAEGSDADTGGAR